MNKDDEEKNNNQTQVGQKTNKKSSKKGSSNNLIPMQSLGFKPKVYYDIYDYVPKKILPKYSKYDIQRRKQNFRAKLTFVIDPHEHQENGPFQCTKRSQWKRINYVIFRSREELFCCICLTRHFVAPQMLFCGHVFCWHCILMHYQKSLKATSCPICNQVFEISELVTCKTIILTSLKQGDKIKLSLKIRKQGFGEERIFNPKTFQQETDFSRIIRMKANAVVQKFIQQKQQIETQLKTNDDEEVTNFLVKVLSKSQQKIQAFQNLANQKGSHLKLNKHQKLVNGIVHRVLQTQESKQKLVNFYQQDTGRFIYMHPICQKYLRKNFQEEYLPYSLQGIILIKQQTEYSFQNMNRYKNLNHLTENQEFDFVIIKMNEFIDARLLDQFQKQITQYKDRRDKIIKFQQLQAEKLKIQYQKQQSYIKQLRKMQESEYHNINVPTNMDPSQIHDMDLFPSLIQHTKSQKLNQVQNIDIINNGLNDRTKSQVNSTQPNKNSIFSAKSKKKQTKFQFKQQDFPGLELAIKMSLSDQKQQPSSPKKQIQNETSKQKQNFKQVINSKIKGKKGKKQKFIDMTHQFFKKDEEEY